MMPIVWHGDTRETVRGFPKDKDGRHQACSNALPGSNKTRRRNMKARRNSTARNVFEDLGFAPPQAMNLQLRATMMDIIIAEIENRGLTQARAAKVLGITQPRVSDLMRGKLHLFSIDT